MHDEKRSVVPETSTTLIRDIADSQHARWEVFHARYEPMMRAFLRERFPSLDADDILQETFVALTRVLPQYVYQPEERGYFHNYLTGVLRNKALKALESRKRIDRLKERVAEDTSVTETSGEDDVEAWRKSIYEIALQQLLADPSVQRRTKQVFVRLTVDGEKPEAVAEAFGMPYNSVIKVRQRMLGYLRTLVENMRNV